MANWTADAIEYGNGRLDYDDEIVDNDAYDRDEYDDYDNSDDDYDEEVPEYLKPNKYGVTGDGPDGNSRWDGGYINCVFVRDENGDICRGSFNFRDPWTEYCGKKCAYVFGGRRARDTMIAPNGEEIVAEGFASDIAEALIVAGKVPDDVEAVICIGIEWNHTSRDLPYDAPMVSDEVARLDVDTSRDVYAEERETYNNVCVPAVVLYDASGGYEGVVDICEVGVSASEGYAYASCDNRVRYFGDVSEDTYDEIGRMMLADAARECVWWCRCYRDGGTTKDPHEVMSPEELANSVNVMAAGELKVKPSDFAKTDGLFAKRAKLMTREVDAKNPELSVLANKLAALPVIWDKAIMVYYDDTSKRLVKPHREPTKRIMSNAATRSGYARSAIAAVVDGVPLEDILA